MTKTADSLILFVKNARLGQVKTRLATTMGPERALAVYQALLQHLSTMVSPLPVTKYVYYHQEIEANDLWPVSKFHLRVQHGEDLGERMANAFSEVLADHSAAILIGSDVPGITPDLLGDALDALRNHDFVIGPAEDGGYYLIGMHTNEPSLFTDMTWSTASVYSETINRMEKLRKSIFHLPVLSDIDREEDWEKLGWDLER